MPGWAPGRRRPRPRPTARSPATVGKSTIRKIERYPDVRRRSVVELGERCGYSAAHARHVSQLALSVFDQTRAVHKLADREREWLEYGALLHDAGVHISYERHHRHSYYLIKNGADPKKICLGIPFYAEFRVRQSDGRVLSMTHTE